MIRLSGKYRKPRRQGYQPVTTTQRPKKKKKKGSPIQRNLIVEGQSPEVAMKGLEVVRENMRWKNIAYIVAIVLGTLLCCFDVRDKGMLFEIIGLLKYSGSLVGVIAIFYGIYGLIHNKEDITIRK